MNCVLVFFSLCLWAPIMGQQITPGANEVIAKSIQYHDPMGLLERKSVTLSLTETRPGGSDRQTVVDINSAKRYFSMLRKVDGTEVRMTQDKDRFEFALNGRKDLTDKERSEHRLNVDRLTTMRDYYHYLWFLPMKLNDPGTVVDEEVKSREFFGREALEIRVSYTPEVGSDIWYFYFDPVSFGLIGYRFYHDESANDGEYILLEEEIVFGGVRLPQQRSWYTHQDGTHLGTDVLTDLHIK